MHDPFRIEPLSRTHDRSRFQSGSVPLDRYFREQVSQDVRRHLATCFVAVSVDTSEVAGYYILAAIGIASINFRPKSPPSFPATRSFLLHSSDALL